MEKEHNVASIYSGAGGLDIGFHKADYKILYSTDYWKPACDSLEKNKMSGLVECEDIRKINFKEVLKKIGNQKIHVLIGGPPCPSFSKSRFYLKEKKRALEDSEGSYVISEYFRAVEELNPQVFLFENVQGFTFKPHSDALELLKKRSKELGYEISTKVINTANYGVPQIRERFICIGVKKDLPKFKFPDETHYDPEKFKEKPFNKDPWITCKEVIGDLDTDLPEDVNMQAGSKHKELLKLVPPGDNYLFFTKERGHPNPQFKWRSRYWSFLLKLSPDKPSWTIQASHSNNMGPFHWKNRFLRIPEIKRIQTFPDEYELVGDFRTQWRQIGNAVPPKIAQILAEEIKKQILDKC